jgi:hypothetical protein
MEDPLTTSVATRTLTAAPRAWYSWRFNIAADGRTVAEIALHSWRERGGLTVEGHHYKAYREHLWSGAFILESNGAVLARAEKPSAFRREFVIAHAGTRWTLRAPSPLRRQFILMSGDLEVGFVRPDSVLRRTATVTLPSALPLAVSVFVVWLVILMWKRDSDAAAS